MFLLVAAAREVVTGRNWRNLPVVTALSLLLLANALTHLEPLDLVPTAALGIRVGLATLLGLIALVGGRLVPSFTHNRLMRQGKTRLPAPAGPLDRVALGLIVTALMAWSIVPEAGATAMLALAGGLATVIRQLRWRPHRIGWEPILLGLHLGYGWLAVGLVLLGSSVLAAGQPSSLAVHALAAGAVGTLILAVMCRTGLAHTGRVPVGDTRTAVAGLLVTTAAVLRILAEVLPDHYPSLLDAAAATWIAGFAMFLIVYTPILVRSSISPKRRPGSPP